MKKFWSIVSVLSLILCLCAGGYAVYYKWNIRQADSTYENLQATVKAASMSEKKTEPTAAPTPEPTAAPTPVPLDIPIDFDMLKEINEDVYAWITVPGTAVDYPVLQDPENDGFYLDHDINKANAYAGAIYSEKQNAKDFSDPNTVLYGHNMKNGSMFASLHKFSDRTFFDENREILIYTPDHIYHYEIFAAYTFDNRHLLNAVDTKDPEEFQKYLKEIYSIRAMDAFFLEEPIVTKEDKILTLSTCKGNSAVRYLVQGYLKEVEG